VAPSRAQRFFDANFTRALGDGDQHDIHQADPADSQCKRADEAQQNLKPDGDRLEVLNLLHQLKTSSARGRRIESVLLRHGVAHRLLDPLVIVGLIVEPDRVKVVRVLEIAHGGEGNVNNAIDVIVARLHLRGKNANHFKADPIDADVLAKSTASGKKFVLGV